MLFPTPFCGVLVSNTLQLWRGNWELCVKAEKGCEKPRTPLRGVPGYAGRRISNGNSSTDNCKLSGNETHGIKDPASG